MAKRTPKPLTHEAMPGYPSMAITLSEEMNSYGTRLFNPTDADRVAMGLFNTVCGAASMNATNLAGQTLRLYSNKPSGSRRWKVAPVGGRELDYMRGNCAHRASTKASVYARDSADVVEVTDHPALWLLRDPEPMSTGSQWWWLYHFQRELTGRAWLWHGCGEGNREPTVLMNLLPQYVVLDYSRTNLIDGVWYGRESTRKAYIPFADLWYSRLFPSATSPVEAHTWTGAVAGLAKSEQAAITSEIQRWGNGGIPGMAIATRGERPVAPEQMKLLRAAIDNQTRGPNKSGSTMTLTGVDVLQYGSKPHEMQYVEGLRLAEERIYRAAGIPESLWKLASSNKASAAAADPMYASLTVLPRLNIVADELNERLLPMFGVERGDMWFEWDTPVKDDEDAKAARLLAGFVAGAVRLNEYRACIKLEPVDDNENTLGRAVIEPAFAASHTPDSDGVAGVVPAEAVYRLSIADALQAAQLVAQVRAGSLPLAAATELLTATGIPADTVGRMLAGAEPVAAIGATPTTDATAAPVGGAPVSSTALNGAQVTALQGLQAAVAAGQLPLENAIATARAAFPMIPEDTLQTIFGGLEEFTPEGEAPAPPPEAQPEPAPAPVTEAKAASVCGCGTTRRTKAAEPADALIDRVRAALKPVLEAQSSGWSLDGSTVRLGNVDDAGLRQVFESVMGEIYADTAAQVAAELGETSTIEAPDAVAFAKERAGELITDITETTRERIQQAVVTGLEDGKNLSDIRAGIVEAAPDIAESRAEVIARTETGRASIQGGQDQAKALGVERKYWLPGECPLCEAAAASFPDGHPIDEPWFTAGESITGTDMVNYTFARDVRNVKDIHPQCFPGSTVVHADDTIAATSCWYEGQLVSIRTERGDTLTGTPNHPVLTPSGWVRMGDLCEGENVVCAFGDVEIAAHPNVKDAPSTIEQVFHAVRLASGVPATSVPVSPEHFHGDGVFVKGNVDIEWTNRELTTVGDESANRLANGSLVSGVERARVLHRDGPLALLLDRLDAATTSGVSGSGLGHSLLGGVLVRPHLAGLGQGSENASGSHVLRDGAPFDASLDADLKRALSEGSVPVQKIVYLESVEFSGHVYNLYTESGVYVAGGIVVHNCTCAETYTRALQ